MIKGIWTAVITPFQTSGELDLENFKRILRDQADARVAGVVICGTTGETPALTEDERKTLISTALKELKGTGLGVAAGTGTYNTQESITFTRWAAEAGVDAVLVVTPYYNKPTPAGLEAHFTAIADAIPQSSQAFVILYNVPGRTGVSLTGETVARLAQHPRIRAIKEASGNVALASEILDACSLRGSNINLMSGDDVTFLPVLNIGGTGVISVASNLFPRGMVAIHKAFEAGNREEATALHKKYYPLFRDLFVESNPGPIKTAMAFAGWCANTVRPPLAPLTAANRGKLEESLRRCGITAGRPA